MTATNSYSFTREEETTAEEIKFNFTPLIFGAVTLISTLSISAIQDTINISKEYTVNSISSIDLTKDSKDSLIPIHNNQLKGSGMSNSTTVPINDILNKEDSDTEEVLDVEELKRLQESFDSFSTRNHEVQLKMTEQLAILTTQMESVSNELSRLNKQQEELPKNIQTEIKKNQAEKTENNRSIWIAPTITGLVIGFVLLIGEYVLSMF